MLPSDSKPRLVIGIMSGTSLDGIDVAAARLQGSGTGLALEQVAFHSVSYPEALRNLLLKNSSPATSSVLEISQLNVRLAHAYADAVRKLADRHGIQLDEIDLIGSHGQTIYHVPDATNCADKPTRSTLQIGDPSTLAILLGIPVVGDFRLADMAAGGQGAPLVPYFDYVYFSAPNENRVLINIGGIGNLTLLPKEGGIDQVMAFDTGPGNMLIDALMQRFFNQPYDKDGHRAAGGTVHNTLLTRLMADPYLQTPPPKSTGREYFDVYYVDTLLASAEELSVQREEDILATVTAFTTASIARAYDQYVKPVRAVDRFMVSGGGVHNRFLMEDLAHRLAPARVDSTLAGGIDPDAKEALCFAVLAHETMNGVPSNVPSATGASRPVILGKICPP